MIEAIPETYKVLQTYNEYQYYIKPFNLHGTRKWYITYNTENFPAFFSVYPDFKDGFDTIDQALERLTQYLEISFPTK